LLALTAFAGFSPAEQSVSAKNHAVRIIKHRPMENTAQEKFDALETLNELRSQIGMPSLRENPILDKAAQAHADYLRLNRISSHHEIRSKKGFSGQRPVDRALAAGYKSRFLGENLSTKSKNGQDSLKGLFSAIYHRFGFLSPEYDEIGVGISQDRSDSDNTAFVYLMGNSDIESLCRGHSFKGNGSYVYKVCKNQKHRIDARAYKQAKKITASLSPRLIKYPYNGEQEVPPAFYNETPDPLPGYEVSGFPVSIEFNFPKQRDIRLVSFKLFEKNSVEVQDVKLIDHHTDPNHKLSKYQFALLPLKRLKYDTAYTARVRYAMAGKTDTVSWEFTTVAPPEKLFVIRKKYASLTMESGKSYWLYFEPRSPHDTLRSMQFPEDVSVGFIDNNTMRVVLDKGRTRNFQIKGSKRVVNIRIK
jgi:uncharacterized protein YkwD